MPDHTKQLRSVVLTSKLQSFNRVIIVIIIANVISIVIIITIIVVSLLTHGLKKLHKYTVNQMLTDGFKN